MKPNPPSRVHSKQQEVDAVLMTVYAAAVCIADSGTNTAHRQAFCKQVSIISPGENNLLSPHS